MFRKILIKIVRLLPVGVLLDALPHIHASVEQDRSMQTRYAFWYMGGPGRRIIATLQRSGPCSAVLTIAGREFKFSVLHSAGLLASLCIKELRFERDKDGNKPDGVGEERTV